MPGMPDTGLTSPGVPGGDCLGGCERGAMPLPNDNSRDLPSQNGWRRPGNRPERTLGVAMTERTVVAAEPIGPDRAQKAAFHVKHSLTPRESPRPHKSLDVSRETLAASGLDYSGKPGARAVPRETLTPEPPHRPPIRTSVLPPGQPPPTTSPPSPRLPVPITGVSRATPTGPPSRLSHRRRAATMTG